MKKGSIKYIRKRDIEEQSNTFNDLINESNRKRIIDKTKISKE